MKEKERRENMTLGKLIEKIIVLRGQQYDEETMTDWVNEIEFQASEKVLDRYEGNTENFTGYNYITDSEKELRIPDRFQDVYITYILAKIDYMNQEMDLYNADAAMQAAAWEGFESWHIRNHKPLNNWKFKNF